MMTMIALSKEGYYTDIGSKFHKIANLYKFSFTAYRAPLNAYDVLYLKKN